MKRYLTIARAELTLLLRNRTVAALAIPSPVLLGVYVVWQQNPQTSEEWLRPILLQLVFVLLFNVFSTVTLTVVSRRQSLMLKRLRASELKDGTLLAGLATPSVVIATLQIVVLQALNVSAGAPMPMNLPLYLLALAGGFAVCVAAGLATTIITRTPEHAQLTSLPFIGVVLAGLFVAMTADDGLMYAVGTAVPGAAPLELVALSWTGELAAPRAGSGIGGVPAIVPLVALLVLWPAVFAVIARRWFRWERRATV